MRTSHYRYPVRLSEEQHRWLETMVHTSSTPAKHYVVALCCLLGTSVRKVDSFEPELFICLAALVLHR